IARVHVLATSDVRTAPVACGPTESLGPGACVIYGDPGQPVALRCFTLDEIRDGRSFMRADQDRLIGLVPDGSPFIDVDVADTSPLLATHENVVSQVVPALREQPTARIALDPAPPDVHVINQTGVDGLAGAVAEQLRQDLKVSVVADSVPGRRRN